MRSLIQKGATVAIIVMASGAAAGQKQSGPIPAILVTQLPTQAPRMPAVHNPAAVVDRILSFDANGDDRIARDELPERMQGKVSLGDKNQDEVLTRDEVVALVAAASPARRVQRFTTRGVASLAEIIVDLKLPRATHDRAMEIVKEHNASPTVNVLAGDKIYVAMRELLDDEDYDNFVAAAARLRNTSGVVGGTVGGVVSTPGVPPR